MEVTGIILAGGKSSRMGTDKGLLKLNGKSMVEYVIDALTEMCSRVLIVSNNIEYRRYGIDVVKDIYEDKGPLGGLYSGLMNSNSQVNICVSCDIPNVNADVFKFLLCHIENYEVILPSYKDRLHPLMGVYSSNCSSIFETQIKNNLLKVETACKLMNYKTVELTEIDFDKSVFDNVNTLDDFNKIKK